MEIERAIEILNPEHREQYDSLETVKEACRMGMEALERMKPVKPKVKVDTWVCGICGYPLEHQEMVGDNVLFHDQYEHCPMCGRKVKWDA